MNRENIGVNIGSKIPISLRKLLEQAVRNHYLNTSDFVRDAVKEKLEREGYLENRRIKAEAL